MYCLFFYMFNNVIIFMKRYMNKVFINEPILRPLVILTSLLFQHNYCRTDMFDLNGAKIARCAV